MAPKNLDKLAKLKVPKNTPPPPNPRDEWDKAVEDALKTTTTTAPPTTTTTVPKTTTRTQRASGSDVIYDPGPRRGSPSSRNVPITAPPTPTTTTPPTTTGTTGGRRQLETSQEVAEVLNAQERRAANLKLSPQEIEKAQEGKKPGGFFGAIASVINFDVIPGSREFRPIRSAVLPAVGAITTGGRAVLSAQEELIDKINQIRGREARYEATDYIPVHRQTGVPIAKPGDFYIRNWEDVINAPVNIQPNATPQQKEQATIDLVKSKARTSAGSVKDVVRAAQDFTYSASDNPYVPETGNKYVDGVIDFSYDVFLDPATYATLGGSAVVTPVATGAKAGTKAAAREAARVAAAEAAETAARVAADATATAAQKAAAQAAAKAAEKAAEKAFKQAAAAAPRRIYGRNAREALANQVRTIRQSAQQVLDDAAATTAEKTVARQAVDVLTDDFIKQVAARGYSVIRGQAAKTLGVRSGARIGLPGFGKATIPYTSTLTNFVGSSLAVPRNAFFQSKAGQRVLNSITAVGEGGLFGSEQILKMRTALRAGTATPEEAVDYTSLLAADKFYRGAVDLARKKAAVDVGKVTRGKNAKVIRSIAEHLATPEADWASKGLRALSASEREAYDSVKTILNNFYKEADSAAALLGADALPALADYWPRSQSTQAIDWAARNGDEADRIATGLGVDRTFFLGNFTNRALGPGKIWFGEVLNGTESIYDLNRIAKDSGRINFDFFETDPVKALAGYANTHAKYLGYATALDRLTRISPSKAKGFAQNLSDEAPSLVATRKPGVTDLGSLENTIANFMTPERLTNWSEAQILAVRDSINDLQSRLAGSSDIVKREFQDAVMEIDEKIEATTRLINAGVVDPASGSLLRAELETYANALALAINNVKREFIVTSPDRWKSVGRTLEDGFVVLNEKTVPDIAVRADIAEIFQNVKRLDDPAFAKAAEKVLLDYNNFFKTAVTTTVGFHTRNALSNTFMMLASGAIPQNLGRGLKIYVSFKKASKAGRTPEQFIQSGLKSGLIKPAEEAAVREAIAYSGATGFGQFGEISAAAGAGKAGVFGKEATGRIPFTGKEVPGLKQASLVLGAPFRGSRRLGTLIEDFNRFQLTFDGLMQGFDAATAAARTGKFLVDYNDISTADRALKQIIPFWIWTTRNMPLQIENMWLNPRAYTIYDKFKNNLEDKEGTSPFVPDYLKQAGAFKLPFGENLYARPDLGFPGAGSPSPLQLLAEGKGLEILASVTPAARVPIEIIRRNTEAEENKNVQEYGRMFFGDRPIPKDISPVEYIIAQGVPGLSTVGRLLNATIGTKSKQAQELLGSKEVRELNATLSFIGLPAFELLDSTQKSEVWRRYFALRDYIDDVIEERREERRQR